MYVSKKLHRRCMLVYIYIYIKTFHALTCKHCLQDAINHEILIIKMVIICYTGIIYKEGQYTHLKLLRSPLMKTVRETGKRRDFGS